ncbi:MAG: serine/threonine protein kinase, partial [Deltaproteobacteria bacterium]|nr:serine/threonine protein kinase [Deltaproteobacteria bacterium]
MTEDPTVTDAAAPAEGAARYCPVCGDAVAARFCPTDGTVTVVRRALKPGDLDYHAGRVVDGRYRVGQRLGHGGFGAVYAAAHTGTGQHVALKVLNVALSSDNAPIVRRFWQEAQVTSRLRHANTVRVFDVGQTEEGAFFLAMELLQGRTLQTRLDDEGPTDEDTAVFIGIEVLKSLNEAHAAGLVHRDLKPANLMLCPGDAPDRPLVKVLDFGIARTADSSLTKTGAALGTPAYMSPEQCRGIPVDGRSDLYALGALLFRCVADRPPFVDENPLTVLFQHADTPPPDVGAVAPQALSPEFCAVVARALAKDPAQRFADAKAMRDALEAPRTAVLPSEAPTRTVRAAPAVATILQALPPVPSPAAHPAAASPAAVATRPRWSRRPILVAVAVTAVAGGAAWLGSQSATVTRSVAEAPTATAPTAGGVPAQPAPTAIPAAAALAPSLTAPPPAA